MEWNDRSALIGRLSESSTPIVLFHASDDPYVVHWLQMDERWRDSGLGSYKCDFLPKGIRSFPKHPIVILYSGIAKFHPGWSNDLFSASHIVQPPGYDGRSGVNTLSLRH